MQLRYWNQMTQFKYELYYFSVCFERCVKLNRHIKIVIAIASSSAIAAWTQWTQLSFLWGLIIVIGQLIGVINEYLPYQQRIKELSEMQPELNALYRN